MKDYSLGVIEARFADIIWENEPISSTELSKRSEEILKWINEGKERHNWPMDRKSIKELIFKEIGGVKKGEKQQADLDAAVQYGFFIESTQKKNGYQMLMPSDDLPF